MLLLQMTKLCLLHSQSTLICEVSLLCVQHYESSYLQSLCQKDVFSASVIYTQTLEMWLKQDLLLINM